jgi:uncharacterized membrane protein YdjX (TVP38/TMEM64 family)
MRIGTQFARLIREGLGAVNANAHAGRQAFCGPVTKAHKAVRSARFGGRCGYLVYIARMSATPPSTNRPRSLTRQLTPLIVVVLLAGAAYVIVGQGGISLAALVQHRVAIDAFVSEHRFLAVLAYIALYVVAVALSLPGAVFLTVSGGFLFGLMVGTSAAVIGATVGATLIFLVARSALGAPLLRRAGPRAAQLAQGFRDDAFSYLLFLRLVPAFPFFLVNLVPAFAGVPLLPFIAATALGVIPGALVYAFAGTGLDSVIAAQKNAYSDCLATARNDCQLSFDAMDVLTPQLIGALIALGLLALVPVVVKRLRAR